MTEEGTLEIRRVPGACCPDCNLGDGNVCAEMHRTLMQSQKKEHLSYLRHLRDEFTDMVAEFACGCSTNYIIERLGKMNNKLNKVLGDSEEGK